MLHMNNYNLYRALRRKYFQIIAFDELKTDYKNPIDQCASLNPLVLPEYILHILFNVLFLMAGEWFSIALNAPLIAYHVHRSAPGAGSLSRRDGIMDVFTDT